MAAQLAVYGFWARGGYGTPAEEVSPSGVRLEGDQYRPDLDGLTFIRGGRALEIEEIRMIEAEVARSAERAVRAGFDAIELQALGGNLLSRFLSPLTNQRDDAYGGSLENRARILVETVAAIKKVVGDDFPLICRINGDDLLEGGMVPEDYQLLVPLLEAAGVHALNLMPGWYETRRPVNQMNVSRGAFVYAAAALKKVAHIPIAANIRINDPQMAEQVLAAGNADLVAMCSALMADPYLPQKAQEGRLEDIRPCVACCNCWSDLAGRRIPIGCSVNARMGMESKYVITPAEKPKSIWVVGGGPAGMEAARVAALRGHRVTLYDNRDQLGGQMLYADLPPHKGEWQEYIRYLSVQLKKRDVEVKLNQKVEADEIIAAGPDAVILATGARSLIPAIAGVKGDHVATCVEVLTGQKAAGDRVVIIGAGSVGCETAEYLIEQGKKVTLLEMQDDIGPDVDYWNRWVLLDRLNNTDIRMVVNARAEEITSGGVQVNVGGQSEFITADSVVLAAGAQSHNPLLARLDGKVKELHSIGDCAKPQKVRQAVDAGFRLGMTI